jgi:ABC-2 type transport system permease protein
VTSGPAEVFDLGYRGYEGERTSRWGRRRAIWRDGVRISLGLGRGAGAKVAPWLLIGVALVPVLVLIVIASFAASLAGESSEVDVPSYADYYGFAVIPIGLLAAIVAPLLLCPDRRDGVLSLYAARPISPTDYVLARTAAFFTVALAAAIVPEAILFGWNALDASSTVSYLRENWDIVPRFVAAGTVVATVFTALSLLTASFTTRRAYAAVATLAVVFVGGAIGGIGEENFSGTLADVLSLADVVQAMVETVDWIFGEDLFTPFSGPEYLLWLSVLTAALMLGLLWRTRKQARA